MAGRILNRRELRRQADSVPQPERGTAEPAATIASPGAARRRKGGAAATVRKPRKPKAPPRMRALWCVYDGGMKEVALFDYSQRAAAEEKLAALRAKQKGAYFL